MKYSAYTTKAGNVHRAEAQSLLVLGALIGAGRRTMVRRRPSFTHYALRSMMMRMVRMVMMMMMMRMKTMMVVSKTHKPYNG